MRTKEKVKQSTVQAKYMLKRNPCRKYNIYYSQTLNNLESLFIPGLFLFHNISYT